MMQTMVAILTGMALLLSACAPKPAAPTASFTETRIPAGIDPFAPTNALTRTDMQGAVIVEATPMNLSDVDGEIAFEVAMNTHSVDLSMDLAASSTLSTDTGVVLQASLWDAPSGGHHVRGRLVFPALKDGRRALEGARRLTLAINGVEDLPRVFEWDLP